MRKRQTAFFGRVIRSGVFGEYRDGRKGVGRARNDAAWNKIVMWANIVDRIEPEHRRSGT